jgi:hypothetical protein
VAFVWNYLKTHDKCPGYGPFIRRRPLAGPVITWSLEQGQFALKHVFSAFMNALFILLL